MNDKDLTLTARAIARRLSYNEDKAQADAKAMLLELAHRLDVRNISVHKYGDCMIVRNGIGRVRDMTFAERLRWSLFNVLPEKV